MSVAGYSSLTALRSREAFFAALLGFGVGFGLSVMAGEGWAASSESDSDRAGDQRFIYLDPIVVAVLSPSGVRGSLAVSLVIEAASTETLGPIKETLPRLISAYQEEIYRLASIPWPDGKRFDAAQAKANLRRISDRLMGAGIVGDVLITRVIER